MELDGELESIVCSTFLTDRRSLPSKAEALAPSFHLQLAPRSRNCSPSIMGATTASYNDAKQPDSRLNRERAKTLLPRYSSDKVSELDTSALTISPERIQDASLSRHGTLLSSGATPLKRTVELKSLLGNANSRLPPGAVTVSHQSRGQEPTSLEQAKPRARVEIDIMLHSNVCVEGGIFKGFIKLRIRPRTTKEPAVLISDGKLRIIGFETVEGDHHEFFQHEAIVAFPSGIYASPPDSEGFFTAREGVHKLDFEMQIPMGAVRCPKGPFYGPSGVAVRYVVLASVKVKDECNKRSIAHFYRDCEIWPRLNPSAILAPAEHPIQATVSKGLFMGGDGEVHLTAALHRSTFVSGARVPVNLSVKNDTKKLVKSLTLTLYRTTVVFKRKLPRGSNSVVELDIDASRTTTNKKAVATSTLEMAQAFPRSHASTDGWWGGIPSGERLDFSHLLLIPSDALTITRGVLIEVEYTIRVSLNAKSLTTDVCVDLPIQIVNLLSLDPPPPPPTVDVQSQGRSTEPSQTVETDYSSTPSGSYHHRSDSSPIGNDEDDAGFQESYTEEDLQDEAQLGNLSMRDDAEDLVFHAIVSAQTADGSLKGGNVDGTSYPRLSEERAEQQPETHEPSSSSEPEPHPDSTHGHISRPSRPRGPSSFALRVQKKLELAATTRQPLGADCDKESPALDLDQDAPTPQNTSNPGLGLGLPSGSVISRVSGYQVASSSFLDDYYFGPGAVSQCNGAESSSSDNAPRPAESQVLPKHPPIVGLPFHEPPADFSALGVATFAVADKQTAELDVSDMACSVEQIKEQHKPRRPPIAPGMSSAGSVKDKIRELEERVRAAEGY